MPLRRVPRALLFLVALASTASAHACTVCDSPNGRSLRAGLFDGHFTHTLLIVLAPVPVFIAAVLLLHLGMPDLTFAEMSLAPDVAPALVPAMDPAQ